MLYKWEANNLENQTLDHDLTIDGLSIGDDPVFINLLIDTGNHYTCTRADIKPNVKNLRCFKGTDRIINIIEEIGTRYKIFGVELLNDGSGNYVEGIIDELHGSFVDINTRIIIEWINGRQNAKSYTWLSLIETLKDIGLTTIAIEVEETLLN